MGLSPFDPAYAYSVQVVRGLDYLFGQAGRYGPDRGICFALGAHETYSTGIAMMAIAASRTPDRVVAVPSSLVNGWTYRQVLDKAVQYFVEAQNPDGGWRYSLNNQPSDNSNTGYATLGLMYARDFGCAIPDSLKIRFNDYVNAIQGADGGSCYTVGGGWENILKTGNLLTEQSFLGDAVTAPRVMAAVSYIQNNWNNPFPDPGWRPNHFQAMYCIRKGFESLGIETITVDGNPVVWYDELSAVILNTQLAAGNWPMDNWGDEILSTVWALLTLERVAPLPPVLPVVLDIHPGSWPNPINTRSRGVVPMAILGTTEFNVLDIDPTTLTINGLSPVRWALEDVAAPAPEGLPGTTLGPDGIPDLTLKFDTQALVATLGELTDRQVVTIKIEGKLAGEPGQAIEGSDQALMLVR